MSEIWNAYVRPRLILTLVSVFLILALCVGTGVAQSVMKKKKPATTLFRYTLHHEQIYPIPPSAKTSMPIGITFDTVGNSYLADSANHRIMRFTAAGKYIGSWGKEGSAAGEFRMPMFIACGTDGTFFVTDTGNYRVQHLDADGKFIAEWPSPDPAPFSMLSGIAVTPDGTVWVTDSRNNKIHLFDSVGKLQRTIETIPANPATFKFPAHLAIAANGAVAVADADRDRVIVFDSAGAFKRVLDATAAGVERFTPRAVVFSPVNTLLVSGSAGGVIFGFDDQFTPLGAVATIAGAANLSLANGAAFHESGTFRICDTAAAAGNLYRSDIATMKGKKVEVPGSITGVDAEDLAGVRVCLQGTIGADRFWSVARPDADGEFQFSGLPNRAVLQVELQFDRTRYTSKRATIRATSNPDADPLRFVLKKKK